MTVPQDVVAIALLTLGSIVTTISLYGVLRMLDINAAVITHVAFGSTFVPLTTPISSHAIAWAAYRGGAARAGERESREENASPT